MLRPHSVDSLDGRFFMNHFAAVGQSKNKNNKNKTEMPPSKKSTEHGLMTKEINQYDSVHLLP